jgi:hypothetical protein
MIFRCSRHIIGKTAQMPFNKMNGRRHPWNALYLPRPKLRRGNNSTVFVPSNRNYRRSYERTLDQDQFFPGNATQYITLAIPEQHLIFHNTYPNDHKSRTSTTFNPQIKTKHESSSYHNPLKSLHANSKINKLNIKHSAGTIPPIISISQPRTGRGVADFRRP